VHLGIYHRVMRGVTYSACCITTFYIPSGRLIIASYTTSWILVRIFFTDDDVWEGPVRQEDIDQVVLRIYPNVCPL
jgi:hypothetical protein